MSESDTATGEDIESYLETGKPKKWYKRKRVWAGVFVALLMLLARWGWGGEGV